MEVSVVNIIQAMLAPGIMISACGLLLLGVNNKYSLVVNRIRILDEEKRKFYYLQKNGELSQDEKHRLYSVTVQIKRLSLRFKIIRNIVISYAVAIAFYIASSLIIGMGFIFDSKIIQYSAIVLFLIGMTSVLIGVIHAISEARKGYEIIQIEINEST